jgi:Domain of unknown function (DUF5666)
MRKRSRLLLFLLATGATVATVACGGGSSSATGPDPSMAAAPQGGATIAGTVQSAAKAATGQVGASSAKGLRVSVTGASLQTVTDDAGRFTLQGVPAGRVELHFEGTDVDARLTLEGLKNDEMLTVTVRVSGSSAALVDDDEGEVDFKGKVDSVGASSLVVDGRTVHVEASTRLLDGKGMPIKLSDFKQGDLVEVEGTAQADGSVLANKVQIKNTEDDEGEDQEVEFSGTITSVTPELVIAGRTVKTDASTKYLGEGEEHKALTQAEVLKVGNKVEVDGVEEPDKSVLAKRIQLDGESED